MIKEKDYRCRTVLTSSIAVRSFIFGSEFVFKDKSRSNILDQKLYLYKSEKYHRFL
jgi:hypothetical protein